MRSTTFLVLTMVAHLSWLGSAQAFQKHATFALPTTLKSAIDQEATAKLDELVQRVPKPKALPVSSSQAFPGARRMTPASSAGYRAPNTPNLPPNGMLTPLVPERVNPVKQPRLNPNPTYPAEPQNSNNTQTNQQGTYRNSGLNHPPFARTSAGAFQRSIGQYTPVFGTVMSFPADPSASVTSNGSAPRSQTGASYSFGDQPSLTSLNAPPNQKSTETEAFRNQFESQLQRQQEEIRQLKQALQKQQTEKQAIIPIQPLPAPTQTDSSGVLTPLDLGQRVSPAPSEPEANTKQDSVGPAILSTSIVGPEALIKGQSDEFEIVVDNSTDSAAKDLIVQIYIPDTLTVSKLDRDSYLDPENRTVSWKIPNIDAGSRETIKFSAISKVTGTHNQKVLVGMAGRFHSEIPFETVVVSEEEFQKSYLQAKSINDQTTLK